MAGGLKLFDYRMTEKEHILAETIIEMTDKSELFRTGLEHFDWSEIKLSLLEIDHTISAIP